MTDKDKFKNVDKIIAKEYNASIGRMGNCHAVWIRKKQLLKEMYGIDWLTPEEEHPEIIFD
ncbi:MAG: hypothetical protein E7379_00670 [Clostridiales bacterium]|nr:hypothetical protein [Clostridiales bacterium]